MSLSDLQNYQSRISDLKVMDQEAASHFLDHDFRNEQNLNIQLPRPTEGSDVVVRRPCEVTILLSGSRIESS